jgi:hypothetical protein
MSLKRLGNFDRVEEVLSAPSCRGAVGAYYLAEDCEVILTNRKYRVEAGVKLTPHLHRAYLMPGNLVVQLTGDFELWDHKGATYLDSDAWCVLGRVG